MLDLSNAKFVYYTLKRTDYTTHIDRAPLQYMDLTYLISGEMTYYYNDEEVHLHAGDAILFPQGSRRERKETHTPVQYASINVHFPDNFTPPIAGHLPDRVTPTVLMLLEIMADAWSAASEFTDDLCLSLTAYLYYQLIASQMESQNPYIKSIKCYITGHLSEKITLQAIADSVHLTPEYCCSLFKKQTGKTVFAYILDQRINAAKRLIVINEMSLQNIAAELGFTDYNYFSRTFKRITGLTPSEYKQTSAAHPMLK